jgi:riboflavin kinase/FMN adenylyltransferase
MTTQTFRTVVLGNFDGLHRGHQQLIALGRQIADANDEELAVFTFYPQIQQVFDESFCYLLTEEQKLERFQQLGVNMVETVPFSPEIASLLPEDFVRAILVEKLHARHVVVGFNFSFGYKGAGNPELLQQLGAAYGMTVTVMDPCYVEGEVVSSTAIRNYLRAGNVEKANALLGYVYSIEGPVLQGNQIGRTIGFPTANIGPAERFLLPANGVYAAQTYVDGKAYPGILNVGLRPSIANSVGINIEVHLFDFDADIYGKVIRAELHAFLRDEVKFATLADLKAQLEKDKARTRALFAKEK